MISGQITVGLLPGLDGTPTGSAGPPPANDGIALDVLAGAWTDPLSRGGTMLTAIDNWRPNKNTMPSIPSHRRKEQRPADRTQPKSA